MADTNWDKYEASSKGNPWFKVENVGDMCRGFLVKKGLKLDDMKTGKELSEVWQRVYTISVPDGESYKAYDSGEKKLVDIKGGQLMAVYGRMPVDMDGRKVSIIANMEDAPLGQLVGFKFTEQRKPSEKGFNGAKIVTGYKFPEHRKDLVQEVISEGGVAADGSGLPF